MIDWVDNTTAFCAGSSLSGILLFAMNECGKPVASVGSALIHSKTYLLAISLPQPFLIVVQQSFLHVAYVVF